VTAHAPRTVSWLGQNSKQGKLQRQLVEVQIRMRLKVSGDRAEIRQSYIPALFPRIVLPLMDKDSGAVCGCCDFRTWLSCLDVFLPKDKVEEVIQYMDEYYVSKDDWDTVVELGVGDCAQDGVLKKIPGSTKTVFTKRLGSSLIFHSLD
jgi:replication factor C subunit 1